MSSMIAAAAESESDCSLPGKIRFISKSNPGKPRVMLSIPSGFNAG